MIESNFNLFFQETLQFKAHLDSLEQSSYSIDIKLETPVSQIHNQISQIQEFFEKKSKIGSPFSNILEKSPPEPHSDTELTKPKPNSMRKWTEENDELLT